MPEKIRVTLKRLRDKIIMKGGRAYKEPRHMRVHQRTIARWGQEAAEHARLQATPKTGIYKALDDRRKRHARRVRARERNDS